MSLKSSLARLEASMARTTKEATERLEVMAEESRARWAETTSHIAETLARSKARRERRSPASETDSE